MDAIVIGAGIAGATVAAHLAETHRVVLIEAEEAAGFHSTGRSAALWEPNYGPPSVIALTRQSKAFFDAPPPGFTDTPILSPRGVMYLAAEDSAATLDHKVAAMPWLQALDADAVRARVPALRPGAVVGGALDTNAFDIDVATLHQGFLRRFRAKGGKLALRHRSGRIARQGGQWQVQTTDGVTLAAPLVVNAAGTWGDEVAAQAGIAPLGLVPKRRTGCIIDPAPFDVQGWPALMDLGDRWYARAEARTRLMVSPVDATPTHPHDVQPEEMDVALAIDAMQAMLAIEVRRVERSWAGLRSFVADGELAFGWEPSAPGFFWCVAQGGYGIQTSPAAGRLVANVIAGRDPGAAGAVLGAIDPARLRPAPLQAPGLHGASA